MDQAYKRLDELQSYKAEDPQNKCSLRIKILIKNMFDDREHGWVKAIKEEKTVKTKDEVAQQILKNEMEKRNQD